MLVSCGKVDRKQYTQAPIKVKTMVVSAWEGSSTSRYVGTIEPVRETALSIQSGGRVEQVHVKNGAHVQANQVLAELEKTQAYNALQGATATLKHAEDGFSRAQQVHEKGVISDQKMVEIESQLAQAQSVYAAAKQRYEECTLFSPCEGVVNGLDVVPGQTVIPGTKICSVVDVSGFSVRFTVPEQEVSLFKSESIHGEVECAAVNKTYPITIIEKSISANRVTHTYEVVARIKGGTDVLLPGMVAVVKVNEERLPESGDFIVIPARCILLKPEGHTVWVAEQGKAVRRRITVDGYQAEGVRVVGGLQPGDTLIIDGYQKLYSDCKVNCE